ncbi:MAG TPA: mechanosensitive ion channel domain-containing protein [Burkholderiales bacterium]|nr:mechanosensitive ion channel domain-containing protein [Burkholderiales bacterium]
MNAPEIPRLLAELWADLRDVRVLWQLAVLAAAFATAAWVSRLLRPRFETGEATLRFTVGGVRRLLFPLTALAAVLVGRAVLRNWHSVALLNVAVPLLTALAIVRVTVYALRRAFAPSGWLRASERSIAWVVWGGFALHITGLAPEILRFLDEVGFSLAGQRVSLLLVLQAVLSVGITLLAALWIGSALEARLMRAATLDLNLRVMLSKLARAALVLAAVLIALPALGVDLTVLSVFGGALGVGIGFGLQKIAANYVSGFIILMDRSVNIGDQVTIDRYTGEITRMSARYLVVRSLDGTEAIIPNETVISSTVVNYTYSNRLVRVALPLQVSYRADLDAVARLLEDIAARHPRVLRDPAPKTLVRQLGESGVDLELGVWIGDPQEGQGGLRSDLYREILREFRARGIETPYHQREVRVLGEPERPGQAGA